MQVGEQVLADYILCHLENPRDKFNLLVYFRHPACFGLRVTVVYLALLI